MKEAIYDLQIFLSYINRAYGEIPAVIPDGIFGRETTEAVRAFQKNNGLEQTGEVDFRLWELIKKDSEKALLSLSEPIAVSDIKNEDLPLKTGDDNRHVYTLHLMLSKLSEHYSNFPFVEISSYFSEETKNNVILWQEAALITPTGEVDKETWNLLSKFYLNKK